MLCVKPYIMWKEAQNTEERREVGGDMELDNMGGGGQQAQEDNLHNGGEKMSEDERRIVAA